jgi:hypothetical protein
MKMLKRENMGIVQEKSVKSIRVSTQLTDDEINDFDKWYSRFDVNFDIYHQT